MGCQVSWPRLKPDVQWADPCALPPESCQCGCGGIPGVDDLDPVAIFVLFEEWNSSREQPR